MLTDRCKTAFVCLAVSTTCVTGLAADLTDQRRSIFSAIFITQLQPGPPEIVFCEVSPRVVQFKSAYQSLIMKNCISHIQCAFSALTLLVGWQRPVKKLEWWGTGMVICLERDADLHMAQLMPLLLTVSCISKIQIGFTFLVLAHPGSPGKRAVKRVYVCVYVYISLG